MSISSDNRWVIAIDLEGFGSAFDKNKRKALTRLGALMEGTYKIAEVYSAPESDRFFAHQIGDGFLIVSDFGAATFETPIALATALLRYLALNDAVGKAFIAEGEFGSYGGCYPSCIIESSDENWHVNVGNSHMFIFSVMGMALVRAYKGLNQAPPGSLLLVDKCDEYKIPKIMPAISMTGNRGRECIAINWLELDLSFLDKLSKQARLQVNDKDAVRGKLNKYLIDNKDELSGAWVRNTKYSLRLE